MNGGRQDCPHRDSIYGRCADCGMTWTEQAASAQAVAEAGGRMKMSASIDPASLVREYGPNWYDLAPFGPDGWSLTRKNKRTTIIVSCADWDGVEWVHASIAHVDRMPDYHDLVRLHKAAWNSAGFAYQVFATNDQHVNIHKYALHLWGRLDGSNVLPDFGALGTI